MPCRQLRFTPITLSVLALLLAFTSEPIDAQAQHAPGHNPAGRPARNLLPMPPLSAQMNRGRVALTSGETNLGGSGPSGLTNSNGQIWREYDITGFTKRRGEKAGQPGEKKSDQLIVEWILRETGTELWFSEPMGVLNADRNRLRVYHTPEIHRLVENVVQRFTHPEIQSHSFGVRMYTMTSPNWRAMAAERMRPVKVQSPGVEAWLASREDAAIILAELRKRSDFREHSSPNLLVRNGETHSIMRMRPVAYTKGFTSMGQAEHGFNLRLSPLMRLDNKHADAVLKIDTHQIEDMKKVTLGAPATESVTRSVQVEVPQSSSWALHERFYWPTDQVILISCGVVATPQQGDNRNALGLKSLPKLGLPGLSRLNSKPSRADALIMTDAKGRSADWMARGDCPPCDGELNYRGRY